MLQAYNYDTGVPMGGIDGPEGLELLGQSAAAMDLAPVPAGMTLLGQSAAAMDLAPVPAGMELLGPYDIGLMDPYAIGLMATEEETKPTAIAATLKLNVDVACDAATGTCTPVTEAAETQIKALQSALNRAIAAYSVEWKPLEVNGVIDANTITTAWTIARKIGLEAHPILKEIGTIDIQKPENVGQVHKLSQRLATAPVGIQKVLDELSTSAVKAEKEAQDKAKKKRRVLWLLGIVAVAGAVTGVVVYTRKAKG